MRPAPVRESPPQRLVYIMVYIIVLKFWPRNSKGVSFGGLTWIIHNLLLPLSG